MQIRIDAQPVGPLTVLEALPDATLAILEGLNGIGKTLSVRLLQLCTGTLPYRKENPAWRSLCEDLGVFRVTVTGLRGASRIEWEADSRDWLDDPHSEFPSFRSMRVDGRDVALDEVRRVLVAHRIGGDEGIIETFAQQADAAAETVRRWARRHTAEQATPLAKLEAILGDVLHELGDWDGSRFTELESAVADADATHQGAATAQEFASQHRDRIVQLRQSARLLNEARTLLPDLVQRIDSVDAAIAQLTSDRERIQGEIMALSAKVGAAEPVLHELRNARRTVERNQARLAESLAYAATIAAELGIDSTMNAVTEFLAILEQRLGELQEEQNSLDTAPVMRQLLDDVMVELAGAEERGLAQQIAVDDPETDAQLTVAQTRAGMGVRRSFLEGQPPPPEARRVADELATVTQRIDRARELREAVAEVDRRRRLVRQNEERVDRAVTATNPDALIQLQKLEARRREGDEQLLLLAAERASLHQQLGVLGEERDVQEFANRLQADATELGVDLDRLDEAGVAAEQTLTDAMAALTSATAHRLSARRDLARATADIRRVSARLESEDEWDWVRRALPVGLLPEAGLSTKQQVLTLDAVRERLVGASERLGRHRTQIAAIESALAGIARHLRGQEPEAAQYVPELQAWFGRRFSDWFNTKGVRNELLPEAEGPIEVDLADRNVVWKADGTSWSRPLEAFSSGEQAFAYTRARLAVLDEESPRPLNRLIVLDEFGAFIAHDRLAGLLSYIRERGTNHPEDQVLVILPLNRNYQEMAEAAIGSEQKRLQRLAAEIQKQKFAVQVLAK